jgi:tRNA(Ile)-lysidine synthase
MIHRQPGSKGAEKRILSDLKRLTRPGTRLLLAVSGGSDSLGLVYYSFHFAKKLGLKLAIGFIDHGLRKGVDKEFAVVERHAASMGIPIYYSAAPPEDVANAESSGSLQGWAREVRYTLLSRMAENSGMDTIATGHTQDDQAETVLLRIIRGTGVDGLSGIPERRTLANGIHVIRPLLHVTRQEIRDFLTSVNAEWVDDPSNSDPRFLRVRLRRELMPLLNSMQPAIRERLTALGDDAFNVVNYLDDHLIEQKITIDNIILGDGVKVDYRQFAKLPKPLWGRVIRLALKRVRGNLRKIERVHIEPIQDLIAKQKSTGVLPLPADVAAYVAHGSIYIFKMPFPPKPKKSLLPQKTGSGVWRIVFDELGVAAEIRSDKPTEVEKLEMRTRRPGDKLWNSKRKFKDILIQKKIPRPYRDYIPAIVQGNKVVSCPELIDTRKKSMEISWIIKESSFVSDLRNIK